MDDRFALRFESGERQGDVIELASGSLTIGRRPGNSLQILDASVSGKHAEFRVENGGVVVKDLGSTNGTRVGGQRVIEAAVAHGDTVHVGNVRLTLVDRELAEQGDPFSGSASATAADRAGPRVDRSDPDDAGGGTVHAGAVSKGAVEADLGSGLSSVSADRLARSKKRSIAGLVFVVLLAAGGGAAWYFLRSPQAEGARARPVVDVPGNLLASSYSFEGEVDGWQADDRATGGFYETPNSGYSGEVGVEADLLAGEWATHASPWLPIGSSRRMTVGAWARADGSLSSMLGLELAGSEAPAYAADEETGEGGADGASGPANVVAWTTVAEASDWTQIEFEVDVPPGFKRARVVLRGDAYGDDGTCAFDDVSLLSQSATPGASYEIGEVDVWALGSPLNGLLLTSLDTPFVTGVRVAGPLPLPESGASSGEDDDAATSVVPARRLGRLEVLEQDAGLGLQVVDLPAGSVRLELFAETVLAEATIATIAASEADDAGGYRTHAAAFERSGVDSLLIGNGRELVRFGFSSSCAVRGVSTGDRMRLDVVLGDLRSFELQLDFAAERKRAKDIAHEARKAERENDLGGCLALWAELLGEFPFEAGLVGEAEATRGRLIEEGMLEVRTVREQVERAQFFRLADLYRQCRARAVAIAERYAPSEVETAAYEVVATLDVELTALTDVSGDDELQRLESIAQGLTSTGSEKLAEEVRTYLEEQRLKSEDD